MPSPSLGAASRAQPRQPFDLNPVRRTSEKSDFWLPEP